MLQIVHDHEKNVFFYLISYREGVKVYTVGPYGLYSCSCFRFHTNANLVWQDGFQKPILKQ
jgi:hypothetical protein